MSDKRDIKPVVGIVNENLWSSLSAYTDARIGLGRTGVSLPTSALLDFQLAHAQAQDAVHTPLDTKALEQQLKSLEQAYSLGTTLQLHSLASDRNQYLKNPNLGRLLDKLSIARLHESTSEPSQRHDLAIVIVDGLSSRAISENTLPFLTDLLSGLKNSKQAWSIAPLSVVQQGRVAIGDDVAERLNAQTVLVLIGERPGLSSPDSLGLYLTWAPKVGLTDASRNCISNVRKAGLSYTDAVRKTLYLLTESRARQLSGVQLKERSQDPLIDAPDDDQNFLIPKPKNPTQ
ncbi:ethanolamine ammonia-lyase subunit EutC [Leucothrix sargassi]|nr:ethanolamine ammonia-lyase subunit EutC [Leucothrix sargassi]